MSVEISISLQASVLQPSVTFRPNFSQVNWTELNDFLAFINWHAEFANCKTVSDYWDKFITIINDGINRFVPLIRAGFNKPKHPHYTKHIRKLLTAKRQRL